MSKKDEKVVTSERVPLSDEQIDAVFSRHLSGFVTIQDQRNAAREILSLAKPVQPERVPLTEQTLKRMHHEDQFGLFCDYDEFEQIARAIEAARGIQPAHKEQP